MLCILHSLIPRIDRRIYLYIYIFIYILKNTRYNIYIYIYIIYIHDKMKIDRQTDGGGDRGKKKGISSERSVA